MEDIIVRGGGKLIIQLWASTPDEGLSSRALACASTG